MVFFELGITLAQGQIGELMVFPNRVSNLGPEQVRDEDFVGIGQGKFKRIRRGKASDYVDGRVQRQFHRSRSRIRPGVWETGPLQTTGADFLENPLAPRLGGLLQSRPRQHGYHLLRHATPLAVGLFHQAAVDVLRNVADLKSENSDSILPCESIMLQSACSLLRSAFFAGAQERPRLPRQQVTGVRTVQPVLFHPVSQFAMLGGSMILLDDIHQFGTPVGILQN